MTSPSAGHDGGERLAGQSPRGEVQAALAQRYLRALEAGNVRAALAVADEAVARQVPTAAIHTEVIQPALQRIGELWWEQELTVAGEHLASQITFRVLTHLRNGVVPPEPAREKVLVAAVEGERHVLGLQMAADLLEGARFDVVFLGSDVPTDALVAAIASHAPAVTALGCTCTAAALVDAVAAIAASGLETRVLVGGQGVPQSLRETRDTWAESSADVVDAVERLLAVEAARAAADLARVRDRCSATGRRRAAGAGPQLTPRQTQVLRGLAEGKSTEQIAAELVLTPVTVRNHIANILAALGVHSRLQAVVAARRRGLIE